MILRGVALGLVLVTALLLQTVVAPAVTVAGIPPDLVVVTVLVLAVLEGPGTGMRYGFAAGLALDLLAAGDSLVGTSALVLLAVGYLAGSTRPFLSGSELIGQIIVAAAGSAFVVVAGTLLDLVLGADVGDLLQMVAEALVVAGWAALLAPVVAVLLGRVSRALPEGQSGG